MLPHVHVYNTESTHNIVVMFVFVTSPMFPICFSYNFASWVF